MATSSNRSLWDSGSIAFSPAGLVLDAKSHTGVRGRRCTIVGASLRCRHPPHNVSVAPVEAVSAKRLGATRIAVQLLKVLDGLAAEPGALASLSMQRLLIR